MAWSWGGGPCWLQKQRPQTLVGVHNTHTTGSERGLRGQTFGPEERVSGSALGSL